MASKRGYWMMCASLCLAAGCYSAPSIDETDDASTGGSGTVADAGDDGGSGMSNAMSSSASSDAAEPHGDESTAGPGSTGRMPADGTSTGDDSSTGALADAGSSSDDGGEATDEGSSSDDSTQPMVPPGNCNETLGVGCGETQFCDYPDDMCGAGAHGVCLPQPELCNLIFQPSCGCNGANYSNPCVATASGTDFAHFGNC